MPRLLIDLFESRKQEIYNKFAADSDQLISIKPDTKNQSQFTTRDAIQALKQLKLPSGTGVFTSNSRVKDDDRSVPVVSTARDAVRIFKFLRSPQGTLFIAKQLLLQTGNTFQNTRLYNPLSTIASTVPFIHVKRSLPPSLGIVPSIPGLLQTTTVTDISSRFQIAGALNAFFGGRDRFFPTVKSIASTYLTSQLKQVAGPFIPQSYRSSRPEFKIFGNGLAPRLSGGAGPVVFDPQPLESRGLPRLNNIATVKSRVISKTRSALLNVAKAGISKLIPKSLRGVVPEIEPEERIEIPTFTESANNFRKKFYEDKRLISGNEKYRLHSAYLTDKNPGDDSDTNDAPFGKPKSGGSKGTSYIIQDRYNLYKRFNTNTKVANLIQYGVIRTPPDDLVNEGKTDIIKFMFSDSNNPAAPVQFRALLSSIKESIKTEFNEQRYVGRTERFVTYGGAKRNVSLGFNIVAFSQPEIDAVWTRVNYLSGLAFPRGVIYGFMIPPLFKITVGGIYDDQPCYIESLDYDFLDESITFDIDKEVPFAVNVNMQLSILEKSTKFHNSPFYKITENVEKEQSTSAANEAASRSV